MSLILKTDPAYHEWVLEIIKRFRNCQVRAAVKVNYEMLRFYWRLGKDISELHLVSKYGSGFYKNLSDDLHDIFPDVHSFSVTNLKYMGYFYDLFPEKINRPQAVDGLDISNYPQIVDDFDSKIFMIPWGHYRLIIDKCRGNTEKGTFLYSQNTGKQLVPGGPDEFSGYGSV